MQNRKQWNKKITRKSAEKTWVNKTNIPLISEVIEDGVMVSRNGFGSASNIRVVIIQPNTRQEFILGTETVIKPNGGWGVIQTQREGV